MFFLVLVNSLNTTRCGKLLYSEVNTYSNKLNNVIMSSTWGRSAWVFICKKISAGFIVKGFAEKILQDFFIYLISKIILENPSETKRSALPSETTYKNSKKNFEWLVGVTDGDGTFSISHHNNKWSLTFKLSQNTYNLKLLYFIKDQLGAGQINIEKTNMANFKIRDRLILKSKIFSIFDKYPLLTTKYFNYIKFKQAHSILLNNSLSTNEKNLLMTNIINLKPSVDYISPV